MSVSEYLTVGCAIFSGWLAASLGWWKWWYEVGEKRKEKMEKEKAHAELKEIHRRALTSNPYFSLSDVAYNSIAFPTENPANWIAVHPFDSSVLSSSSIKVNPKQGGVDMIWLLLDHTGSRAVNMTATIAGEPATFVYGHWDGFHKILALRYAFKPELYGVEQDIKISFTSETGIKDAHTYKTTHGFRIFRRVDPA